VTDPRVPPEPGPLAQEAALLAAAVREWLTTHGAPAAAPDGAAFTAPWAALWDAPASDVGDKGTTDQGPRGAAGQAQGDDPPPAGHTGPPWTVAPGATLCTGCPLCRLLASFSGSQTEVLLHLLAAASELAAAVRAAWPLLATAPDPPDGSAAAQPPGNPTAQRPRPPRERVQRINVQ
jgi:hypothetical protein